MSSDLCGCFALQPGIVDVPRLLEFLGQFGMRFVGSSSRFAYDEDYLGEEPAPAAKWEQYVADMNSASASLNGNFAGPAYSFSLGFLVAQDGRRYGLFCVSGRAIEDMANALAQRSKNYLEFFAGLGASLGAPSMAFGMEVDNQSLISFIHGELPLADVDRFISTAAGVSQTSEQMLRTDPRVREIEVGAGMVLSRWLPGLDAYFKAN